MLCLHVYSNEHIYLFQNVSANHKVTFRRLIIVEKTSGISEAKDIYSMLLIPLRVNTASNIH